jgi:hypothetical protein
MTASRQATVARLSTGPRTGWAMLTFQSGSAGNVQSWVLRELFSLGCADLDRVTWKRGGE